MLAHGKLASPFLWRVNGAPASKSTQQPGAGDNAGKRQRKQEFDTQQRERSEQARNRVAQGNIMTNMMKLANELAESGEPHKLFAARAIAAEVARMQSGG